MNNMRCPEISDRMTKAMKPIIGEIFNRKSHQPYPPQCEIQIKKAPVVVNHPKNTQRKELCECIYKQVPNPHRQTGDGVFGFKAAGFFFYINPQLDQQQNDKKWNSIYKYRRRVT